VVPDHQLSLAIGKEGQNARLAAKLTGWKIDIRSESEAEELDAEDPVEEEPAAEEPAPEDPATQVSEEDAFGSEESSD
ncbi:transcription termination/antitermination protein NusA, partial [Clostridium boliviensis]|nr:transcription termination/antitermination protein NusA [Clostridium boliviensis]